MAQLSLEEARNLSNRICWLGNFYELGFYDLPLCFAEARFKIKSISPASSLEDFLKEWDAGASGDHACKSDKVDTNSLEFKLALERLNTTLSVENIEALEKIGKMTNLSEDQILVGIGVHLIRQLTGTAKTTWSKSQIQCPCQCGVKLDYSKTMYIGSEVTLHGELDILSLVGITAAEKIPDYVEDEASTLERRSSNGRNINVEFERKNDDKPGQQQVIAQAITYGWTHYNRHRDLSPNIPLLFIDGTKFGLFMYNPKLDSLFVCECPLMFIAEDSMKPHDKYSGIFILWLILHHRLFFRKETVYDQSKYYCKFKEQVTIESYEELKDYSVCVRGHKEGIQWGPAKLGLWAEERKRKRNSDSD